VQTAIRPDNNDEGAGCVGLSRMDRGRNPRDIEDLLRVAIESVHSMNLSGVATRVSSL
jgi:hypothetical protein